MRIILILLLLLPVIVVIGQDADKLNSPNPFFTRWDTPFETPPFNLITNEHYVPAFKEGMKQHKAEVDAIINSKDEATFENTIEALEISGELLTKVNSVFQHIDNVENTPETQKISEEMTPLLSAHNDDISFNEKLFTRIKAVYEKRDKLNPEQKYLTEKYYSDFVRSGAALNPKEKDDLRKINEELSLASLKFSQNVLKETNAFELVIDDPKDLKGLPESSLTAASESAKKKGYEGKYLFTLQAPSYRPIILYADNRELREKMYKAYMNRANHDNEFDNKEVISQIASLRLRRANLLGFKSHAEFVMAEYMAKNPGRVYDFLSQMQEPANRLAKNEAAKLQKIIDAEGGKFKLEPWDWSYYSEKLKKQEYNLDEEELRSYFTLDNVLNGVFTVTGKLYGIKFEEKKDIVTYNPDVKVFEVKEADGRHIGIIYFDYFPREGKRAGAWMNPFRPQNRAGGKEVTPIVMNCGNLNKPTEGKPALLTLGEVRTIFHEFGHALHGLFSNVTYPRLAGTNVAWDFVELPSQIMENWATHPEVLKMFTKHYETGAVMPDELIARIQNAKLFNKGYETLASYITPSLLDMKYHDITEDKKINVTDVENEIKKDIIPEIGLRYPSTINSHIFAGGYSAGYYSYIWAEVLDADAFQAFEETSLFDKKTAALFRENILSRGGTQDPLELYVKFRGKEPSPEALMKRRGLL